MQDTGWKINPWTLLTTDPDQWTLPRTAYVLDTSNYLAFELMDNDHLMTLASSDVAQFGCGDVYQCFIERTCSVLTFKYQNDKAYMIFVELVKILTALCSFITAYIIFSN